MKFNRKRYIFDFLAKWRVGDGVGGSEVKIGVVQSRDHCCTICRSQSKNGVFANGATVDSANGTICYCEFGMTRRNSNTKWTSTFIDGGLLLFYPMITLGSVRIVLWKVLGAVG